MIELWHITFEEKGIQAVLRPKVPDCSIRGENVSTSRISLAPTVNECIRGVGQEAAFTIGKKRIYAYKIVINEDDTCLYNYEYLYRNKLVSDALLTHEYWYMKPIFPKEVLIYEVQCLETKKYTIIENKQNNRLRKILCEMDSNRNIPENLSPFEIVNYLLDERTAASVKAELNHKVYEYKEGDQAYMLYKHIWAEEPQMYHIENDYYEANYIENTKLKKIGICQDLFIIDEIFSKRGLVKACNSGEFMLSTWKIVDDKYIGNCDCHLFLITDANQIPIGILYYYEHNDRVHISAFEVANSVRGIGLGTAIMKLILRKNQIDVNKIILESLNKESERFWNKLGVKCSLY